MKLNFFALGVLLILPLFYSYTDARGEPGKPGTPFYLKELNNNYPLATTRVKQVNTKWNINSGKKLKYHLDMLWDRHLTTLKAGKQDKADDFFNTQATMDLTANHDETLKLVINNGKVKKKTGSKQAQWTTLKGKEKETIISNISQYGVLPKDIGTENLFLQFLLVLPIQPLKPGQSIAYDHEIETILENRPFIAKGKFVHTLHNFVTCNHAVCANIETTFEFKNTINAKPMTFDFSWKGIGHTYYDIAKGQVVDAAVAFTKLSTIKAASVDATAVKREDMYGHIKKIDKQ